MSSAEALKITFPCENYLVIVVTLAMSDNERETLFSIVRSVDMNYSVTINTSKNSNYFSYRFRLRVDKHEQLAKLNSELQDLLFVKMVL